MSGVKTNDGEAMTGDAEQLRLILTLAAWFWGAGVVIVLFCFVLFSYPKRNFFSFSF